MSENQRLAVFENFIYEARSFFAANPDTEARMKHITILLEGLVRDPTLRQHSKSWPSAEGHKNLLFYEDPDYNFVVNAVVRTPGRDGRVHDHGHAWTAYGVLDGAERLELYRRIDDGKRMDYALIQLESISEGKAGKVDLVAPFASHPEKGCAERSVVVIVRPERLVGKVLQGRYDGKMDKYHQSEARRRCRSRWGRSFFALTNADRSSLSEKESRRQQSRPSIVEDVPPFNLSSHKRRGSPIRTSCPAKRPKVFVSR